MSMIKLMLIMLRSILFISVLCFMFVGELFASQYFCLDPNKSSDKEIQEKINKEKDAVISVLKGYVDNDVLSAKCELARLYSLDKNMKDGKLMAQKLWSEACDGGDVASCYFLSGIYRDKDSANYSIEKAISLLNYASSNGYTNADVTLAVLYLTGKETQCSIVKSLKFFKKAARGGDVVSQLFLASCYMHGNLVERNISEAKVWLELATKNGSSDALYLLGYISELGLSGEVDMALAVEYYRKSSNLGNAAAKNRLATIKY